MASVSLETATGLIKLSKIGVFQHYFPLALAWLLLLAEDYNSPEVVTALILFLIGSACIVACACSADDIAGFRNGSDALNYSASDTLRDIRRKPLLSGAVTERQAVAFSISMGSGAVLFGAAAFLTLDWDAPLAAYLLYGVGFACSVQYSVGLRFSYHRGGGETLLLLSTAAGLLAPFLAVHGEWTADATITALLLGLWLVMVSSYSNVNDAAGDRSVGRRTLAVTTSATTLHAAMVVFFALSVALTLALVLAAPAWPVWTLVTMLPATCLHARQLALGPGQGKWLEARKTGLVAYNLGFLGLALPAVAMA